MLNEEQKAALLAKLSEFDFIVVIDKSGSMGEEDMNGRSRWEHMQETAVAFTRDIEKIDSDGLGLVLFSGTSIVKDDGVGVAKLKDVFATNHPGGSTPLHSALTAALSLRKPAGGKKAIIVVFTDGVPDDKGAAADVIRKQANSQSTDDECTFLFVQVGRDAQATKYLHQLDDELTGAKFDIVCAKTIEEAEKFDSTAELVAFAIDN
jgi:Mg-chelatase subunit ChlD